VVQFILASGENNWLSFQESVEQRRREAEADIEKLTPVNTGVFLLIGLKSYLSFYLHPDNNRTIKSHPNKDKNHPRSHIVGIIYKNWSGVWRLNCQQLELVEKNTNSTRYALINKVMALKT
jgi:hypothetical protein